MVLNVKDDARVGHRKMASPRITTQSNVGLGQKNGVAVDRGLVSDYYTSVDNALRWFELLLGTRSNLL